jgi:Tol biopolymer transport system component
MVLVADVDGGQPIAVTTEPLTSVAALAWSPDGRRLAIVTGLDTARQIWLASTDGSTAPVKVDTDLVAEEVAWRPPDGREIVFRGTATPGTGYRLYLANADGTNVRQLSPVAGSDSADYTPGFSPDGERLFYVRWDEEGGHLYGFDLAADAETEIGPKDGRSVAAFGVSPDGARVSLLIPSLIDHGPTQIAVAASDGTGPVIDTGPQFLDVRAYHRWAPDGTVILAWHGSGTMLMYVDPAGGPARDLDWPGVIDPDYQRLAP